MIDTEIVTLYRDATGGNQAAWASLHAAFNQLVLAWIRRAGGHSGDLEDISQEAWVSLWKASQSGVMFNTAAQLLSYLALCARNRTIDAWDRRNARKRPVLVDMPQRLKTHSYLDTMVEIADSLTKDERELCELLVFGLTIGEIAQQRKTTEAAVYRQRRGLKQRLITPDE